MTRTNQHLKFVQVMVDPSLTASAQGQKPKTASATNGHVDQLPIHQPTSTVAYYDMGVIQ